MLTTGQDRYYIETTSELPDEHVLVLKHGDAFAVFNRYGDILDIGRTQQGIFIGGTRHLSRLRVRIDGRYLALLNAAATTDDTSIRVDLTNPDLEDPDGRVRLRHGAIHVDREKMLFRGLYTERITLVNYDPEPIRAELTIEVCADFKDIFEVRGMVRKRRGETLAPKLTPHAIALAYQGLDGVVRTTAVRFEPPPTRIDEHGAAFDIRLEPGEPIIIDLTLTNGQPPTELDGVLHDAVAAALQREVLAERREFCDIRPTNEFLAEWIDRSISDVRVLTTDLTEGWYPFAGIPWYTCPFGRDGIITAIQMLWVNSTIARGVLSFLAATQADKHEPERHAEPGKIVHEIRGGEMAATGEIPFGRYYGTVDATPLFIVLAGRYERWTGDTALIERLWPNITRALTWIDEYGDLDHDGFIEYRNDAKEGLTNQGWKDSFDAIFHDDGSTPVGPIALCEVQGYVYEAKREAARLAHKFGDDALARKLRESAERLREKFERAFWLDDLGTYALALDGQKRPCRVRASNAGHVLWSGLARPERARRVVRTLLSPDMSSGWGIRTVAKGEARYNPMSYHNGSIWPHDNAIIASGFARYGLKRAARQVLRTWLDASAFFDLARLPELICGFDRRGAQGPTLYPVACSPQAWASGMVFMLLRACLGLNVIASKYLVCVHRPLLPRGVDELCVSGLRVADRRVDFRLRRERSGVGVAVEHRDPGVRVVVTK